MNKLVIITLIAATIVISITVYGFSLQEEPTKLIEEEILENALMSPEKTRFSDPVAFDYASDPFGHYEKWCNAIEGKYSIIDDSDNPIVCMFDRSDRVKVSEQLREYRDIRIEGELAKRLCLAYKIDDSKCLDDIKIHVTLDMETDYLLKDKKIDDVMYEFRIINNQDIQYRQSYANSVDWKDAEIDR